MTTSIRPLRTLMLVAAMALLPSGLLLTAEPAAARVTVEYDQPLPHIPGKSLRVVRVDYAPGGSSAAHTHAKSAFVHVRILQGSVRSAVNDAPARVYRAGESFQEQPGDLHRVSGNASRTEPASLLATFIVDTADTELTSPVAQPERQ